MYRITRLLILFILALLPHFIKKCAYRRLFGYNIGMNTKIGIVIIDCQTFVVGNHSTIASGTIFWQCQNVIIGDYVSIGVLNIFRGGKLIKLHNYSKLIRLNVINAIIKHNFKYLPDSVFELGYGSVITAEHRIDFTDRVIIGKKTIIGGRNSSIWTHNRRSGRCVVVGDYCYVGSEVRIAPGVNVPSRCIVGLGSVVADSFIAEQQLITGVPARHTRWLNNSDYELLYDKTRDDIPD